MESKTLKSAEQKIQIADHLLNTTYSVVREPKLLVSVIDNIFQAFELLITATLEHEKKLKNITTYDDRFEVKMDIFKRKIITKYSLDNKVSEHIIELKNLLEFHKKTAVEFTKKEKFVITDNDYNLKTISFEEAKKTLEKSKKYFKEICKSIGDDL